VSLLISSSYLWSEGQNRILRTFGPKRDEIMGGWREFRKLRNLYSLPDVIRMTVKEDEMGRACNTRERRAMHRVLVEKLKKKTTRTQVGGY
jgi:hypothetical protein